MGKNKTLGGEFQIQKIKKRANLNKDIANFREMNPQYEIYNMNVSASGGTMGSDIHV